MPVKQIICTLALLGLSAHAEEWNSLFNGKNLSGWSGQGVPADTTNEFRKADSGTILVDSLGQPDHDYVWLMSDAEFKDFE